MTTLAPPRFRPDSISEQVLGISAYSAAGRKILISVGLCGVSVEVARTTHVEAGIRVMIGCIVHDGVAVTLSYNPKVWK